MASIIRKKKGNQVYYYVAAPVPLEAFARDAGLPAALWQAARLSGALDLLLSVWPAPRRGPSISHFLLLAAFHRICAPGPKTEVADWYRHSILADLWGFSPALFSSQAFWDHFDAIDVSDSLQHPHPDELERAQRGHSKQRCHDLRQIGLSYALHREHGLGLCHHVSPGNVTDRDELPACLGRITRLLDGASIPRETVTLVLDKGSAALANTLQLQASGLGWVAELPWDRDRAALRARPVEQLEAVAGEPGVRVGAERTLVHGDEYLGGTCNSRSTTTRCTGSGRSVSGGPRW